MSHKKVAIVTLGCKVNQYESASLASMFQERGYTVVDFGDVADIYIINTCTVTHLGDRKSRQLIRRAVRANADARVVVTGCYAQTSPGEVLAIDGVDLVVGTRDKAKIVELVESTSKARQPVSVVSDVFQRPEFEELPVPGHAERVRAFLKVQEGCNNYCAYCIIPYARGPLSSRKFDTVLSEARRLVGEGYKEIVLTGIHTGAYGQDLGDNMDLAALVAKLVEIPGLARLRLSSVEPMDITRNLVDVLVNSPVLCRHLHIPLQSGDDTVLSRMRRSYNTAEFRELVEDIRLRVPEVAITTDVIVGFPGETTEQFENTYQFVQNMAFAALHVFKYSPRKGTPAAGFPDQVAPSQKEERSSRLISLGHELARNFASRYLGRTLAVLVEQPSETGPGLWEGFTDNYIRVIFPCDPGRRSQIVSVRAEELLDTHLKGSLKSN